MKICKNKCLKVFHQLKLYHSSSTHAAYINERGRCVGEDVRCEIKGCFFFFLLLCNCSFLLSACLAHFGSRTAPLNCPLCCPPSLSVLLPPLSSLQLRSVSCELCWQWSAAVTCSNYKTFSHDKMLIISLQKSDKMFNFSSPAFDLHVNLFVSVTALCFNAQTL